MIKILSAILLLPLGIVGQRKVEVSTVLQRSDIEAMRFYRPAANDSIYFVWGDGNRQFLYRDSVAIRAGGDVSGKLNISDTVSMITPYLRKVDTASMLSTYARTNAVTLKLNKSDTTSMLGAYLRSVNAAASYQSINANLTTISGLTATTDNFLVSVASAWASRTPAQVKTTLALNNVDNTSDASKPISTATQTAINLKSDLAGPTFTGSPNISTATGTSLAVTGAITSSGTAGIGYATGAGGTVTQTGNKSTGVTLNKITGEITTTASALAAATIVSFTLTNSTIAATDVIILNHKSGGTIGAYTLNAAAAAGSAVFYLRNNTAGSLSDAIVIRFTVIKGISN